MMYDYHNPDVHQFSKPSDLSPKIMATIQHHVVISKDLKVKLDSSKTTPKRNLYLKKLRKNNDIVYELLKQYNVLNPTSND